jgi:mannose-6-phosphate isomerase-like protein (cupin superfamily)
MRGAFMRNDALLTDYGRIAALVVLALTFAALSVGQGGQPHLRAKVVALDGSAKELSVLSGSPESMGMMSGYIVLSPGKSVGKHGTGRHEELLVVLEGAGEMLFQNGSKLPVKANTAVYCPPETEHDVMNSGTQVLRYVYVVAEVR